MNQEHKKDMIIYGIIFVAVLVLSVIFMIKNKKNPVDVYSNKQPAPKETTMTQETNTTPPAAVVNTPPTQRKTYSQPPAMMLNSSKTYQVVLHTTDGDITLNLFADKTPLTVNNFVFLTKEGFYNGTKFHRIIKDFMIQGGDPEGTGAGGPGYQFADEKFDGSYTPGILAMANAGPNTNGSQFFIMHKQAGLPKNYVIFGQVADPAGMAVLDKIANTPVAANAFGELSQPTEDVLINTAEVIEK